LNSITYDEHAFNAICDIVIEECSRRHWLIVPFILRDLHITHCRGCFECWTRHPGRCKFKDAGQDIANALINCDLAVLITPVTFGGYSAVLKKALDRLLCLLLPFFTTVHGEVHHRNRYRRYPPFLAIGTLLDSDAAGERIFASLVQRNAINMHTVGHSAVLHINGTANEDHRQKLHEVFNQLELQP